MTAVYQTQVTAVGGREGSTASSDRRMRLDLSIPDALGGDGGKNTNPEQLFAAAYAACYLSAIRQVAGQNGVTISADANVTATVILSRALDDEDGDPFRLAVALCVDLPDVNPQAAERVLAAAHAVCPYSQALLGRTEVTTKIL